MMEVVSQYAPHIISGLATFAAAAATFHIVLHKTDARSAVGWIGLSWLVPLIGVGMYLVFGVNRIRRRARSLRRDFQPHHEGATNVDPVAPTEARERFPDGARHLGGLARLSDAVVQRELLPGNQVEPYFNGDEAYPAMLEAIRAAEESISLATYIFDNDEWGRRFATALGHASDRGVDVRVLIDATGLRYSIPSILSPLKKAGVRTVRFLPTIIPPHPMSVNLRNHRKTLVVDGRRGFTGGMNIRDAHVLGADPRFPTRDLHFELTGPVVSHLQEVFADDWRFATGEEISGDAWFPTLESKGEVLARGISDGPDEDLDKLHWVIQGAITQARESVRIVTPYFLPDETLRTALIVASLRGVDIDIFLPEKNNLPYVKWASMGQLEPLLAHNCRVWMTPPPFNHSKLMVVDRFWTLIGSANIDPRSLVLNFEFNVECYDRDFASHMDDWAMAQRQDARQITLQDYHARSLPVKLRDGLFRLMAPYL